MGSLNMIAIEVIEQPQTLDQKVLLVVHKDMIELNRPGFVGDSKTLFPERMEFMNKSMRYAPEYRERAVRPVFGRQGEHGSRWATIRSIATG